MRPNSRRRSGLLVTRLCTAGLALAIVVALAALARALPVGGSAYYAQLALTVAGIPLNVAPQPQVTLPPEGGSETESGASINLGLPLGLINVTALSADGIEVHTEGDPATDTVLSRATGGALELLGVDALLPPTDVGLLRLGAVEMECQLNPVDGRTSHAAVAGLESDLLGNVLDSALWASPPPNTGLSIGGLGDVVLHEVEKEQVGDQTFYRFNAVSLDISTNLLPLVGGLVGGELVLGHVECAGTRPIPTAVSPTSGPAGTVVTITGTGFLEGATVQIGGVPATDVTVVSDTEIQATVPELRAGTWAVSVETHVDRGTLADAFTSAAAPEGTLVGGDAFGVSLTVGAPPLLPALSIGPVPVAQMPEGGGFDTDSLVGIGTPEDGGILGGGILGTGILPDGLLLAGAINASVNGQPAGVLLRSEVVAADVNLGGGLLSFDGATVACELDTETGELVGSTSILGLDSTLLGETVINDILAALALNEDFEINIPGLGQVVLNEQIPASNGVDTLTVRGLRINLLNGLGELILFEANCSAADLQQIGPPTIDEGAGAITPPSGPLAGGTVVTITGTNFVPGDTEVTFGGVPGTDVTVAPDGMSLTVVTPAGAAAGPVDVTVTTSNGSATVEDGFTYIPNDVVLPVIIDVQPPEGDEGTEVTITGENFQDGAVVIICGQEVSATFVSDTELSFIAPACPEGGPQDVTVLNPDEGSDTAEDAFTYPTVIVDPPTIDDGPDAIDPSEGPLAGGQTVTITGTNFVDGETEVTFDDVPGTDVTVAPDGTSLTVVTPPGAAPGLVDVTVTTPNGSDTATDGYTYLSEDGPTIDPNNGLSPPSGPVSGGTVVIIKGTNFVEGMEVTFDGAPGTDLVVHDSMTLEVITPPAPSGTPGPVDVVVTTSAGSDTAEGGFTYTDDAVVPPTITAVSPPTGEEGTEITIEGEGFQDGAVVTICGVEVTPESVTPTEIVLLAPPCDEVGVPQDVTVCNPDEGCVTEDAAFTYVTPEEPLGEPTVASFDPNAGPHAGGTEVIIIGTNFVAGAEITFGSVPATEVEVLSPTVMRVVSPPSGLPTTTDAPVDVAVTTPGGTADMPSGYTYLAQVVGPPTIGPVPGSITPPSGPLSGGTEVTITGSNFVVGDTEVLFGANPGGDVTVSPDGMSLTVVTPPGDDVGPVDVTVTTPNGSATAPDGFTYHADDIVLPIITSVSPPEGEEGTEVTIEGENFQNGAEVIICGQVVTPVSVTPTEIVFIAPACEEGGPQDVTVVNPDDGSATAPEAFTYPVGPPTIGPVPGSITPPSGPLSGGTTVTITGSNFMPGETEVLFGGNSGTNVTVSPNGMSLTVVTPPGAAIGPVDVTVTTPNGSATAPDGFTYHADDVVSPVIIGVSPPEGEEGTEVTIEGENFQDGATVIICGQEVTPVSVTPTEIVFIAPACEEGGPQDVTVVNPDGGSATAPDAFTYPGEAVVYRQLFAEGAVGSFFRTDVGVLNTSRTEPANVLVTVYPETPDSAVEFELTLDPLKRTTVDLNQVLGGANVGASVRIESDQPIAAMRNMMWDNSNYGSHMESGQPDSSTEWFFGEGATYIFDVFHLLLNENDQDANVTITYLRAAGQGPPVVQEVVVPANTRQTIWANAVPGLQSVEISAVITSDLPIVAERAMYLSGTDRPFVAGQAGAGATAPSTTWNIAEGATHFFDTFLFFTNANDEEALVTITYLLPDGATVVKQHTVAARSKRTLLVDATEDPQLEDTAFAATVTSTAPIIVERAMWWGPNAEHWYEAHASLGTTETGTVFGIGEGKSGGPTEEDTYVLVSNASTNPAPVRFTLVYDDGSSEEKTFNLLGSSRLTVLLTTEFPESEGRRFSVLVESLEDAPIAVEVSRYQSTGKIFGFAGGTAQATKIQ